MQLRQWSWRSFATAAAVLAATGVLYAAAQDFAAARAAMISNLRRQEIRNERLLGAMTRVPRHLFVASRYRNRSYDDVEVPAVQGDVISRPQVIALMIQTLDPRPNAKVLEVATGAGYETAVLADMGMRVYTLERRSDVAKGASVRLASLGYTSVHFACGDGTQGWANHAPYDAIIVAAAVDRAPPTLVKQLADGGRLVVPIGHGPEQSLNLLTKSGGLLRSSVVGNIRMSASLNQPSR